MKNKLNNLQSLLLICALVSAAPLASLAEPSKGAPGIAAGVVTSKELGHVGAGGMLELNAKVTAVNPETREVSLRRTDGKIVTIEAGEDVRNFNQIHVGDNLHIKYTTAVVLELKKAGGQPLSRTETEDMTRAKLGEKPGGKITRKITVIADVEHVDLENSRVTLHGPKEIVELAVPDPVQLKNIKKGDQVQAIYTEAVAISVAAAPANS